VGAVSLKRCVTVETACSFTADSTVTPTSLPHMSTPTTVQISGTTFTSGLAYLSYAGVTAFGPSGTCGTTVGPGILPVPSSDVSSYRGHAAAMPIAGDIQYPFNFADLAPNPVPWDAWISQETCYTQQDYPTCQTITQAAYRPWIVYPRAFWSLEPRWSNCGSGVFGIMDPPTALPQAHEVASLTWATATGDPTSTAVPKQDPGMSRPIQTTANHGTTESKLSEPSAQDISTEGRSLVSLRSHTLGSEQPAPTTHSKNALSVLQAAGTQGQPNAKFTLDDHVYTAYPGGLVAGDETLILLTPDRATRMDGHVLSMGDGKFWIDSTALTFKQTHGGRGSRTAGPGKSSSHPGGKSQHDLQHTSLPKIVSADRSVGPGTIASVGLPTSNGESTHTSGSKVLSNAVKSLVELELAMAILAALILI
jgi:hypothetical protein